MMAIQSRRNQFRGINAHLHRVMQQQTAEWPVFHKAHVLDIWRAIDPILPPGYGVVAEHSLQIRQFHLETGEEIVVRQARQMQPVVTIIERSQSSG